MKKIFIAALSLLLMSTFTACGSFNDAFKDEADKISMAGVLTEQGITDDLSGTHVLIDKNGDLIAVRSLSINLGSDKYLGNELEILGFINEEDGVFEITGITVMEVLNKVPFNEVEFLPYEHSELGFKLKYYSDWKVTDGSNEVAFIAPAQDEGFAGVNINQFSFDYYPNEFEDGTTDTALIAYFDNKGVDDLSGNFSKVGVDKLDAVRFEEDDLIEYYLYRNGIIYHISYTSSPKDVFEQFKSVFLEMLLEFRFTVVSHSESDDSTLSGDELKVELLENSLDMEMSSYESLHYFFRGQYPDDWYYAGSTSSDPIIVHHYGFSDEVVSGDNEIISVDLVQISVPAGNNISKNGQEYTVSQVGGQYIVYTKIGTQTFRVKGDAGYKDLILFMAQSIDSTDKVE